MKPERILKSTKDAYGSFKSYTDKGTVDIINEVSKKSIEFSTSFVRPSKVRFQWRPQAEQEWHLLCSTGKKAWTLFHNQLEESDLRKAVGACAGSSSGAIHLILKMLAPDLISATNTWYQMENPQLVSDSDNINEQRCYHLRGTSQKEYDTECWISRDDLLVRRISRQTEISADEANKMLGTAVDLLQTMNEINMMFSSSPDLLRKMEAASEQLPKRMTSDLRYKTVYNFQQVTINDNVPDELFNIDPALLAGAKK